MPDIHYFFGKDNYCTVKSELGKDNQDVKECMKRVAKALVQQMNKNLKFVYISHGWNGKDINKSKVFRAMIDNLLEKYEQSGIVVGAMTWLYGSSKKWHEKNGLKRRLFKNLFGLWKNPTGDPNDKKWMKQRVCCDVRDDDGKCHVYYAVAAANIWPIGNIVAYVNHEIIGLVNRGKDSIPTYCIGHSLGSHLCGFFFKQTRVLKSNVQRVKIIGLDPAGVIFPDKEMSGKTNGEMYEFGLRLEKVDADSVEIFHTSKAYGYTQPLGYLYIVCNHYEIKFWLAQLVLFNHIISFVKFKALRTITSTVGLRSPTALP